MYTEENKEDLISIENTYEIASQGKRFANYIIDLVLFYILVFGIAIVVALVSPDLINNIADESPGLDLIDRLLSLILYGFYMSVVESVFKGKSLGKLITGTRAVNLDGSRISIGTAFGRGFSRAVPFCAFSALGTPCNPWQDRWTNTVVIDEKKSTIN